MPSKPKRCYWGEIDPLMEKYHDEVWGVPVHNDRKLFEFLVLESAQAGLSWRTILHRAKGYRRAFANFNPKKVADFGKRDVNRLLKDTGIIRNRAKIEATVKNARAFLEVQDEFGSFDKYIWGFVDGTPIQNTWKTLEELPAHTPLAVTISKDLKQRGFAFIGPTVCYAHMQATGMVNDHVVTCFRHKQVAKLA